MVFRQIYKKTRLLPFALAAEEAAVADNDDKGTGTASVCGSGVEAGAARKAGKRNDYY